MSTDVYKIWWKGHHRGLGEPLILAWLTQVFNDNGIYAVYEQHPRMKRLSPIICPTTADLNGNENIKKLSWYYHAEDQTPIHLQYLRYYGMMLHKELKVKSWYPPVKYFDIPEVRHVDVVMNTRTGKFTPYKQWPYFTELKQLFDKHNITYVDLDKDWRETYGIRCLNYARYAKLYIGLDTGMAHYVSRFIQGKALIIQGGYVHFRYWAHPYNYTAIQIEDLPCRHCLINKNKIRKGITCPYNHRCMKEITPDIVFNHVLERLNK